MAVYTTGYQNFKLSHNELNILLKRLHSAAISHELRARPESHRTLS